MTCPFKHVMVTAIDAKRRFLTYPEINDKLS